MNNIDTLTLMVLTEGEVPADGETPHRIEATTKLGHSLIPNINVTFILSGSATFSDGTQTTQKMTDVFGQAVVDVVNQVGETVAVTGSANHLHDAVTVIFEGASLPEVPDIHIAAPNGYVVFEGNVISGSYTYLSQSGLVEGDSIHRWKAENGDILTTNVGNENTPSALDLGDYSMYVGQRIRFCVTPIDVENNQGHERCEWSTDALTNSENQFS